MNEELIPQFSALVDQLAEDIIESIKQSYNLKEYSVENIMLNVFTACIFKTVAPHIKKDDVESFCEQIKTNLKINFEVIKKELK